MIKFGLFLSVSAVVLQEGEGQEVEQQWSRWRWSRSLVQMTAITVQLLLWRQSGGKMLEGVPAWYDIYSCNVIISYCSTALQIQQKSDMITLLTKLYLVRVVSLFCQILSFCIKTLLCVCFSPEDEQSREQPPSCSGSCICRPRRSQGSRRAHQNGTSVWDTLFWTQWLQYSRVIFFHNHNDLHYLVSHREQQHHDSRSTH